MKKKLKNHRSSINDGFFARVYEITRLVPYGRVTSYGAIARYLGTALSARMVGWALNQSHSSDDFIPAHRVVNRIGMLTGKHHFGGSKVMQELLESEGIHVQDDQVVDFKKFYWDPSKELI
jgi:methylated-DNA-protein-cysteine methyltransferase related protein